MVIGIVRNLLRVIDVLLPRISRGSDCFLVS